MALKPCSSCPSFFTLCSMVNSVYILDATMKLTVFAPVYIHIHTPGHHILYCFIFEFPIRQARIGRESQRKKRNYTDSAVSSDFMFSLVHKLSRASRINYRNIKDLHTLSSLKSDFYKIIYLYINQFLHPDISKRLLTQVRLQKYAKTNQRHNQIIKIHYRLAIYLIKI